ncbi:MAG: hypothetical protein KF858_01460 [Candidatus Sumerlaeia bacterium]|nr:hypothetical protein [Candidatus Sumerlaeia bacterium]
MLTQVARRTIKSGALVFVALVIVVYACEATRVMFLMRTYQVSIDCAEWPGKAQDVESMVQSGLEATRLDPAKFLITVEDFHEPTDSWSVVLTGEDGQLWHGRLRKTAEAPRVEFSFGMAL